MSMDKQINYIITPSFITIWVVGNTTKFTLASGDKGFNELRSTIIELSQTCAGGSATWVSEDDYNHIMSFDPQNMVQTINKSSKIQVTDTDVTIENEPMPKGLVNKLKTLAKNGDDVRYLEKFWDKLKKNPSQRSRQCLFDFCNCNNITITKDGDLLAYKGVMDDFKDIWTNTIDNSPGRIVEISRNLVDPDPDKGCSHGLHVATHSFATKYAGNGTVVSVIVDPADVVSVPHDCDHQKIRVCRYTVDKVVKKQISKEVYTNKKASSKYKAQISLSADTRLTIPTTLSNKDGKASVLADNLVGYVERKFGKSIIIAPKNVARHRKVKDYIFIKDRRIPASLIKKFFNRNYTFCYDFEVTATEVNKYGIVSMSVKPI